MKFSKYFSLDASDGFTWFMLLRWETFELCNFKNSFSYWICAPFTVGLFMQLELTTGLGAQSTNMVFFIGIREGRLWRYIWTLQNDNKESHVGTALFWHETFVNPLIEAFHRKSSKAGLKSCLLSNYRYSSDSNGQR